MADARTTALALALVVGLAFAAIVSGERTFADTGWLAAITPARMAAGDAIAAGHLPAWWDHAGLGVPLLADAGHGALYPPTWLAALGGRWLDVVAVAHLWLLAFATAGLARRLGADAAGALVAGAAAGLAGIASAALVTGTLFALAWAPLIVRAALAVADASEAPARLRAAIGLALAVTASALAGAPAATGWAAVAAVAVVALDGRTPRRAVRGLAWTVGAMALGALAAAVQLAPALLHAIDGQAAGAPVTSPGPRLLALLAPGAAPAAGWPSFAGGAAIVVLAALAPARARAAALGLVAAGTLSPAAAAVAWPLVAALAGAGLTSLADGRATRGDHLRALTVVSGLAVVLAAAAALRYPLAATLDRAGLDGAAVVERGLARGAMAIAIAAAVTAAVLLAARRRSAALAAVAGLAAVVEVALAGHGAVPRMERPGPPAFALADGPVTRVFRSLRSPIDDDDPAARVTADLDRLAGARGAPWGLAAVPSSDPARLAVEDRLAAATAAVATRLLDRFAIGRAVVPASIVVPADLAVLAQRGDETLIALAPGRPPAFWTTRWRRADDDETLRSLAPPPSTPLAPLSVVHLAPRDGAPTGAAPADDARPLEACGIDRPRPGRVTLRCHVTAAGYAVLLDAWAPGWSARVDGARVPVERADLLARAVAVPAGARTVELRYRPPGLVLGALVSALALLNLALAGWLARRPRQP